MKLLSTKLETNINDSKLTSQDFSTKIDKIHQELNLKFIVSSIRLANIESALKLAIEFDSKYIGTASTIVSRI